jgi:hypothetical protein
LQLKRVVVCCAICLSVAVARAAQPPVFLGDNTDLRKALRYAAEYVEAVYTVKNLAVMVRVYPEELDFRVADHVPGHVPWRPAWLHPLLLSERIDKAEIELLKKSNFTQIMREEDGKTCLVNELTGARVFSQSSQQQDRTAVEMPCSKIWESFETLAEVSEESRLEIISMLKAPPVPRTRSTPGPIYSR